MSQLLRWIGAAAAGAAPPLAVPLITNAGTITSASLGIVGVVHTVTGFAYTAGAETVTYQWERGGTPIALNGTSETYTPVNADRGTNLTRVTTVTNASGSDNDETAAQAIAAASIAYVDEEQYGSNTGTLPSAVAAGDIIIALAFNQASNTIPTLDANFTSVNTEVRTTLCAGRLGYRIAASAGEFTSAGTWTNATRLAILHYRPTNGALSIPATTKSNGTATTITTPALTTPGATSWGGVLTGLSVSVTYTSGETHTRRGSFGGSVRLAGWDGNAASGGTFGTQSIVVSASTGWTSIAFELAIS
jgi:hypothetical protein